MATTDNGQLKKYLEGIRDERGTHANTATRIGTAMLRLLDAIEGQSFMLEERFAQKVDTDFFNRLFSAQDANGNAISVNDMTIEADSIRANYGLWTEQFLSTLGKEDSEDEAGSTELGALLSSLNGSGLSAPTSAQAGYGIVWDGEKWTYGKTGGGDGSGTGTSVDLTGYATEAWVESKGYLTSHQSLADYATQAWVKQQGYLTAHQSLDGYTPLTTFNSHAENTTVHITAAERTKWNNVAAIMDSPDSDSIINKWQEVVSFLDTYTEANTLAGLLGNKVDKVSGKGLSTNDLTDALLATLRDKYTKSESDGRYVQVEWFKKLFTVHVGDDTDGGNTVAPNGAMSGTDYSIEAMFGFWTKQYLSTLGKGDNEGDGGIVVDLTGYATEEWVRQQGYLTSQSLENYATQAWVRQQGYLTSYTEQYKGTVTQVKVGSTAYNPKDGVVSLPAYPTTLPASDVYAWAKAASKPGYTWDEITGKPESFTPSAHNHDDRYTKTADYQLLTVQGDGTTAGTYKPTEALTLNIEAGSNIKVTADAANKKITIANTYSYTHPTNGANTTISAASGKVLSAITVNNLGHVTSVASKTLAFADMPSMYWANVKVGSAADTETVPTFKSVKIGGVTITYDEVNHGLLFDGGIASESYVSTLGKEDDDSGSTGGVLDEGQLWNILNGGKGSTPKQIASTFLSTALAGYATTAQLSNYVLTSQLASYATRAWVNTQLGSYMLRDVVDDTTYISGSGLPNAVVINGDSVLYEIRQGSDGKLHVAYGRLALPDKLSELTNDLISSWALAKSKPSYSWSEITGKPTTFTPSAHTHTKADITDFAHTHDDRYKFGTAGTDYVPVTLGSTTKNVLTAHQSLASYMTTAAAQSSFVTALGTSGNYLTWTKNGSTSNITVPYATAALKLVNTQVADTMSAMDGMTVRWYANIPSDGNGKAGNSYGFPVAYNANGLLWLGAYYGTANYGGQIGISSDSSIYYRYMYPSAQASEPWKKLAFTTDTVAAAQKLTTDAGSATKGVYFSGGVPVAMTYALNANVNSGTQNYMAFYSGANTINGTTYLRKIDETVNGKTLVGLYVIGNGSVGNDATAMLSGTKGLFRYGDTGARIRFAINTGAAQKGELIFTDHNAAGGGVSWHFVTDQGNETNTSGANVVSDYFTAKRLLTVGANILNTGYNLYVAGTARVTGRLYLSDSVYLEYDSSNGGVHVVGGGLYTDTFLSCLGDGEDDGSSSGGVLDEGQLWNILNGGKGSTPKQIASTFLSTALAGYVLTSQLASYVTKSYLSASLDGYMFRDLVDDTTYSNNIPTTQVINGDTIPYDIQLESDGKLHVRCGCLAVDDTQNTAGATNTSSKIFLIGATAQTASPQTYSHDTAYVGTDGCLYSGGAKVLTAHQSLANYVTLATAQTITAKKTFSVQQAFTAGTGTAPFTVSSTTVVGNLNADLLDGLHATAFAYRNSAAGIAECGGGGNYNYAKIATIKIVNSYINRPITFEISGRGRMTSWVQVMFNNVNNTDPGLLSFITDNETCYYIYKSGTSTWEVYGQYNEPWGTFVLHRILGCGANIGVTVNMANASSLPSGTTQAAYHPGRGLYPNIATAGMGATDIPSGTNYDTLLKAGTYCCQSAGNNRGCTNVPYVDGNSRLWHIVNTGTDGNASSQWSAQLALAPNAARWFTRSHSQSTFGDWLEILTTGVLHAGGYNLYVQDYNAQTHPNAKNYWHCLGHYVTDGDNANITIEIFSGNGYNGAGSQNSFARIVIKDGYQATKAKEKSVGVTVETFGNTGNVKAEVVATSDTEGMVWVQLPWNAKRGDYFVKGRYKSWTHHSTPTAETVYIPGKTVRTVTFAADTATAPTSNQNATRYFDYIKAQWDGSGAKSVTVLYDTYIGNDGTTADLHVTGGVSADGYISCLCTDTTSDERQKDILNAVGLTVEQVAGMPAVRFMWKNRRELGVQAGTTAQAWQAVLPEVVHERADGTLGLEYGVAAMLASIVTARRVADHERRIGELERRLRDE